MGAIYPKPKQRGELLRPDLRQMPGDLVTKDIDDPDKVHPLDPEHIHLSLADEYIERQTAEDAPTPEPQKFSVLHKRVSDLGQDGIALVMLRVFRELANTRATRVRRGGYVDLTVKHMWFPKDSFDQYSLENGNPPPDSQRPKYLRGMELVMDLFSIPKCVRRLIERHGGDLSDLNVAERMGHEFKEKLINEEIDREMDSQIVTFQ